MALTLEKVLSVAIEAVRAATQRRTPAALEVDVRCGARATRLQVVAHGRQRVVRVRGDRRAQTLIYMYVHVLYMWHILLTT